MAMKRTIITFCLLLVASIVWAQEVHTAEYFELNTPIPSAESHEYQAASHIMLASGFHSKPDAGQQVMLKVNRNLITMEWYYEIQNDDGSITYQHLVCAADTTVNNKDVKVIIRTNTLYDKHSVVTHEYVYEEFGKVYWWNKTLEEFTVLYDYAAETGNEWTIAVGNDSIVMHVDTVEQCEYEGRMFKMLQVSDADDLFSGNILCGVGHLASFFPERLMTKGKAYHVEGIRCYWRNGELVFKQGNRDCDEVYEQIHNGLGEMDDAAFAVYPNPTDGVLFIRTHAVRPYEEYRITNLMGQTVLTGNLNTENQQINVSDLPQGMYFITFAGATRKFVVD